MRRLMTESLGRPMTWRNAPGMQFIRAFDAMSDGGGVL